MTDENIPLPEGTKTLEVQRESGTPFRVTVPKASRVTFGPWSPPSSKEGFDRQGRALTGTLRIFGSVFVAGLVVAAVRWFGR